MYNLGGMGYGIKSDKSMGEGGGGRSPWVEV